MAAVWDVVIVGGGVAGLSAAAALVDQDSDLRVLLIEARDRLGGRVCTDYDPQTGEPLELGAEFVHGRPAGLLGALREAGLRAVEDPRDGVERVGGSSPFEEMPRLLAPELTRGGDRSFEALLNARRIRGWQRMMLRSFVNGFYLAPPREASTRALARMELAAAEIHGDQAAQVAEGYQAFARHLAAALPPARVWLGTAVNHIRWRAHEVDLWARSRAGAPLDPLRARALLLAVPFTALAGRTAQGSITLDPVVPAKRRAARALRMGHATKVLLRFREPLPIPSFVLSRGLVPVWWTPVRHPSPWVIGWAGGAAASRVDRLKEGELVTQALDAFRLGTGLSRKVLAEELSAVRVAAWSREPYIHGAYAWVPVGGDGAMAELAQPVEDTLFFAGEATEPALAGTVHGAYESGRRAAREIAASLGTGPKRGTRRR